MFHRLAPPLGAEKFPSATSFRIAFSKDRSATTRFNLAFSRSKPFSFFAWSAFRPPYSLRQR